MRNWPPIAEPQLLERLALDGEEFVAYFLGIAAAWPRREFDRAAFEQAVGYPWERPAGSFVLAGEQVQPLRDLDPVARAAAVAAFTAGRHPIVSFGANAAPTRLALKFAHLADGADREALVLTGALHDHDVGAVPSLSLLGYVPASLFASPGTAVRASVVWVTPTQFEQLAWSELTYRFGCLEEARFEVEDIDLDIGDVFAFVSRLGALWVDGAPVAMAAVPAERRTAPALTQTELLDLVAGILLAPEARAEDLARAACADLHGVMTRATELLWPRGRALSSRWIPYPESPGP